MSGPTPAGAVADALATVARTDRLLVCCDYDGTLAPLVDDPAAAWPQPGAVAALEALAALPDTPVVLLSGRARDALAAVTGAPSGVRLVGSHGVETDEPLVLTPDEQERLADLGAAARALATGVPGARVERKPAGVAVHAREVAEADQDAVLAAAAGLAAADPGLHATPGKLVLELSVLPGGKGVALQRLRDELAATAVLFLGDDVTDEAAFAALAAADVGVKVGDGPSAATFRVADPAAAVEVLRQVHDVRRQHHVRARAGDG